MSKNYGISGWRIGYVIANRNLVSPHSKDKINTLITCQPRFWILSRSSLYELLEITNPDSRRCMQTQRLAEYMRQNRSVLISLAQLLFTYLCRSSLRASDPRILHTTATKELISVVPGIGYGKSCSEFVCPRNAIEICYAGSKERIGAGHCHILCLAQRL